MVSLCYMYVKKIWEINNFEIQIIFWCLPPLAGKQSFVGDNVYIKVVNKTL